MPHFRRTGRFLLGMVFFVVWGAALWGSLNFTSGETEYVHSICGIWGCGPPTHVLIGWHLFWCIVFAPMFGLGLRRLGGTCLLHLGEGLFATGFLMALGIIGVDLASWWPEATELQRSYVDRRIPFALVTTVEVPALEILMAGLIFILVSFFSRRRTTCSSFHCSASVSSEGVISSP